MSSFIQMFFIRTCNRDNGRDNSGDYNYIELLFRS